MIVLSDVEIGALGAAIIAGAIALANLVGGKENKTSAFRQAWIDALRTDTSRFISHAVTLDRMIGTKPRDREAIWNACPEHAVTLIQAASNIRMRLNPEEKSSKDVLNLVKDIEKLLGFDAPAPVNVSEKSLDLIKAVNDVLQGDWRRVKKGEPRYRSAVWLAGTVLVIAVIILAISLLYPAPPSPSHKTLPPFTPATKSKSVTPQH
jgi:hypothetical protein